MGGGARGNTDWEGEPSLRRSESRSTHSLLGCAARVICGYGAAPPSGATRLLPGTIKKPVISIQYSGALPAAVVAIVFALLARVVRAVSDGGALAGVVIAFLLISAGGLAGFVPLLVVFLLTLVATRWRGDRKRNIGVAEHRGGRRASQVLANLGATGLCAAAAVIFPRHAGTLMVGGMAALAEAAADTVSSEIGQAVCAQPRLILGFEPAPAGTNGAMSLEGTLAGCIAASIVAWSSSFSNILPLRWSPVVALAGTAGMFLDSILGAALENPGWMGNDSVNFVSTVFAADLALMVMLVAGNTGR